MSVLPPLRLVGGRVLREGRLRHESISLAEGRLSDAALPDVDLSGYLVLPGIIDLHGDGFERHLAPRRTAAFPMADGLSSYDRECAANGVTTAYLAQGWSWEGGPRSPDGAMALIEAWSAWQSEAMTDLRIQIRAETHMVDTTDRLIAAVRRYALDYVVFNDHIAEAQMIARDDPAEFALWAQKLGRSADDMRASLDAVVARSGEVPRHLLGLAEAFDTLGVTYGSHDDPDAETREKYRMMGAEIAEFPLHYCAAAAARAAGNPILMGAPNAVRGGSHTGNVSAQALIADGLCDGLVSDYHIPALALAVRALTERGILPFEAAWGLVSSGPARVLGLADRGRIAAGLRADLVVMNAETMRLEATISAGRLSHMSGGIAGRFLSLPSVERLAAE